MPIIYRGAKTRDRKKHPNWYWFDDVPFSVGAYIDRCFQSRISNNVLISFRDIALPFFESVLFWTPYFFIHFLIILSICQNSLTRRIIEYNILIKKKGRIFCWWTIASEGRLVFVRSLIYASDGNLNVRSCLASRGKRNSTESFSIPEVFWLARVERRFIVLLAVWKKSTDDERSNNNSRMHVQIRQSSSFLSRRRGFNLDAKKPRRNCIFPYDETRFSLFTLSSKICGSFYSHDRWRCWSIDRLILNNR